MLRLRDVGKGEYRALYAYMKRDFPGNERPPYFAVKGNLRRQVYTAMFLEQSGETVGYAVVTAPAAASFALVSYLAIAPKFRSRGLGSELLTLLIRRFAGRILALEVESPAAAESADIRALRERRIAFYRRAGFRIVPTVRAVIFGVAMEIMVNTEENVGSVREMMRGLYRPSLPSEHWLRFIDVVDGEP